MFDRILLPIDLSDESSWKKALPAALKLCGAPDATPDATLHILNVLPDFGMTVVGQYFPEGYEKDVADKALENLHRFVGDHVPGDVNVQHIVSVGSVYEMILKTADDLGIDLIVMGAHRPELKNFLLGPNAARVVRHSNCSVMVVRE